MAVATDIGVDWVTLTAKRSRDGAGGAACGLLNQHMSPSGIMTNSWWITQQSKPITASRWWMVVDGGSICCQLITAQLGSVHKQSAAAPLYSHSGSCLLRECHWVTPSHSHTSMSNTVSRQYACLVALEVSATYRRFRHLSAGLSPRRTDTASQF